jgi:serine/threonine protein kinase
MTHNYKLLEEIGSGSYSKVYKAIHVPTNLLVAIKVLKKDQINSTKKQNEFQNEIEILKSLNHPFISQIFDFFASPNHYYIVMEYCPNGSLRQLIKKSEKLDEKNAMYIFIQLVSVLEYLHLTKHIIHRDLKARNIMFIMGSNAGLMDFHFSKKFLPENEKFQTSWSTRHICLLK